MVDCLASNISTVDCPASNMSTVDCPASNISTVDCPASNISTIFRTRTVIYIELREGMGYPVQELLTVTGHL